MFVSTLIESHIVLILIFCGSGDIQLDRFISRPTNITGTEYHNFHLDLLITYPKKYLHDLTTIKLK